MEQCCGECGRELPQPRTVGVNLEVLYRKSVFIEVTARTPKEAIKIATTQAMKEARETYDDMMSCGHEVDDVEVEDVSTDWEEPKPKKK